MLSWRAFASLAILTALFVASLGFLAEDTVLRPARCTNCVIGSLLLSADTPDYLTFDPATGDLITDSCTPGENCTTYIINGATDAVASWTPNLHGIVSSLAYDAFDGDLYGYRATVDGGASEDSFNLTLLSASTFALMGTTALPAVAFTQSMFTVPDEASKGIDIGIGNDLYVELNGRLSFVGSNSLSNEYLLGANPLTGVLYTSTASADSDVVNLTSLNGATGAVEASTELYDNSGTVDYGGFVYDAATGDLGLAFANWGQASNGHGGYIDQDGNGTVDVFDASATEIVRQVTVGRAPTSLAYDAANGNVYVTNDGSNNVSVFSGTDGRFVASIATDGDPGLITYDSDNLCLYLSAFSSQPGPDGGTPEVSIIAPPGSSCPVPPVSGLVEWEWATALAGGLFVTGVVVLIVLSRKRKDEKPPKPNTADWDQLELFPAPGTEGPYRLPEDEAGEDAESESDESAEPKG